MLKPDKVSNGKPRVPNSPAVFWSKSAGSSSVAKLCLKFFRSSTTHETIELHRVTHFDLKQGTLFLFFTISRLNKKGKQQALRMSKVSLAINYNQQTRGAAVAVRTPIILRRTCQNTSTSVGKHMHTHTHTLQAKSNQLLIATKKANKKRKANVRLTIDKRCWLGRQEKRRDRSTHGH